MQTMHVFHHKPIFSAHTQKFSLAHNSFLALTISPNCSITLNIYMRVVVYEILLNESFHLNHHLAKALTGEESVVKAVIEFRIWTKTADSEWTKVFYGLLQFIDTPVLWGVNWSQDAVECIFKTRCHCSRCRELCHFIQRGKEEVIGFHPSTFCSL